VLLAAGAWYNPVPPISAVFGRADGVSHDFSICGTGSRIHCVVDGGTFWLAGQKIRISDINPPEVSEPRCAAEAALGARAARRLQDLLNAGPLEVRRGLRDQDKYGGKLRTIHREGQSIGEVLVSEGLASSSLGDKKNWCG
jgi:endonuclease YncB( thermonuclease family)